MKKENKYVVSVGNIGNIEEEGKFDAIDTFNWYVNASKSNKGRAAGESVILFCNDEIIKEYNGANDLVNEG